MKREDIENQIQIWLADENIVQTKENFIALISDWLDSQTQSVQMAQSVTPDKIDDLTKQQIMGDLESYQGFRNLEG